MTMNLAGLFPGRRNAIPGLPDSERAAVAMTFVSGSPLVIQRPGNRFGPAHSGFESRFGMPVAGVAALVPAAPGKPLPVRIARQVTPAAPAPVRHAPSEMPAKVADVLRRGGLWREIDLGQELGVSVDMARHALRTLQDDGKAVHVSLGHWRSRFRSVDLFVHGRSTSARMVGLCLAGLSIPADEMAEHLDISETEARSEAERLVGQGHLRKMARDLYQCPDDMRERIVGALGPELLSELGARVVDAMSGGTPMRKTDIALAVGVGRGSANRMVDRLVEDGWLAENENGEFSLA